VVNEYSLFMSKRHASGALASINEHVKKHVTAIHTSGELSLPERKTAYMLLLNAYDALLTKRTHFR
jgi:hypothetical protein